MSVNFNGLYIIKGLSEFDFGRKKGRKERRKDRWKRKLEDIGREFTSSK